MREWRMCLLILVAFVLLAFVQHHSTLVNFTTYSVGYQRLYGPSNDDLLHNPSCSTHQDWCYGTQYRNEGSL